MVKSRQEIPAIRLWVLRQCAYFITFPAALTIGPKKKWVRPKFQADFRSFKNFGSFMA
jgi:hypothetical protein